MIKANRLPLMTTVEFRVILQLLQQRVTDLEEKLRSKDKIIGSLTSELKSLRSDHQHLSADHECPKAEATSRFTKYDSFQKSANEKFKTVDIDLKDIENLNGKTHDDQQNDPQLSEKNQFTQP